MASDTVGVKPTGIIGPILACPGRLFLATAVPPAYGSGFGTAFPAAIGLPPAPAILCNHCRLGSPVYCSLDPIYISGSRLCLLLCCLALVLPKNPRTRLFMIVASRYSCHLLTVLFRLYGIFKNCERN